MIAMSWGSDVIWIVKATMFAVVTLLWVYLVVSYID